MSELIEIEEMEAIEIEDAPAQLTTISTVIDGVPMMDATEARAVVTRIKTRIDVARGELLELHDREGWKALGYRNWEACARQEFGGSAAQMYRLLSAAQIERAIDSPIGEYPESHLREVAKLDSPDQQRAALNIAASASDGKPTAKDVRQAVEAIAAPSPDLDDILLRLDAHGYAKSSTREKGITTFYSFRDYSGRSDETGGEIELAEGELSIWLAELDSHAAYAQAKQERFIDARDRAERLGYDLKRDGDRFVLTPMGQKVPALVGTLDQLIKTIEGYERNAAKKATADPPALPSEDEQHRATIEAILRQPHTPALIQQAYDHAAEIRGLELHNTMIALIDRATDEPPTVPAGWVCEGCGARITDMRKPMTPICATCEIQRQAARVSDARPPAVPPRPRRPVSADVSAQIAYVGQLEAYASALETFIMELQRRCQ